SPDLTHIQDQVTQVMRLPDDHFQLAIADGSQIRARAVIVATGAAAQRLYVAGEKEYTGRGVSFSAVSHAPFFKDRMVAVVGGSQLTLIAALELSQIARHVHLLFGTPHALHAAAAAHLARQTLS